MDLLDRFTPEQLRLLGALGALLFGLILSRQPNGVRYLGFIVVAGALGVAGHTWLKHGRALLRPSGCWVGSHEDAPTKTGATAPSPPSSPARARSPASG